MQHKKNKKSINYELHIQGLVQGVGFRPFIYRLANALNLEGSIENRNDGVFIKTSCSNAKIKIFEHQIIKHAPLASQIHSIAVRKVNPEEYSEFKIIKSQNLSNEITQVSPDIAVCDDCMADIEKQNHRLNYSFTNCTNCGPRFSIIKDLPYDRPQTTMQGFELCYLCNEEYNNVSDRRFHAQPIACNNCGPIYNLIQNNKSITNINDIVNEITDGINVGKVYAVKGLGGFHLMCDAENEMAVNKIRNIKNRDGKPFAIMTNSLKNVEQIAEISETEKETLTSWQRPIVLLKYKKGLAKSVTNELNKIGVMLPYMPFHYQLLKKLKTRFIVLTSGNISDEPIVIANKNASLIFGGKVDGTLSYNRDIHNRVDDSVSVVINNKLRVIRRSRGYAPQPILTELNTEGIFAAGAELANSFSIGKANQAIMSQYIGDLKNIETFDFYEETFQRFKKLFKFEPKLIVADLHGDYLSSQFAQKLSAEYKIPLIKVQHHHAHIASVMLSNNLNQQVIGVSFDGLGLGNDKKLWGAEFMIADLVSFDRLFHFENIPMPGGDKASKEPWRMAVSYLHRVYGNKLLDQNLPILKKIEESKIKNVIQMLDKNINAPLCSSAGRLFDAVASLIDVTHFNSFQAEAPMRLESIIANNETGSYIFELNAKNICFSNMIENITKDFREGISKSVISAKFHNTIIKLVIKVVKKIAHQKGLNKVILSGGTFQNTYLTKHIENKLKSEGFEIYHPNSIPVNDQGIALGQLAIAAQQRSLGLI